LSDDVSSFVKSGRLFIDKTIHIIYYYIIRKVKDGKIYICIDFSYILKIITSTFVLVITIQDKTGKIEYIPGKINEKKQLIITTKTNLEGENTIILYFLDENGNERIKTSFKTYDSKELIRKYEKLLKDKKIEAINNFIEESKKSPEKFQGDSLNLVSEEMCESLKKKSESLKEKVNSREEKKRKALKKNIEIVINNIRSRKSKTYENIIRDTVVSSVKDDDRGIENDMKIEILLCIFDALSNIIREKRFGCICPVYDQFAKDYIQSKPKIEIKFLLIENFIKENPNEPVHDAIIAALNRIIKNKKIKCEKLKEEEIECLEKACDLKN